MTSPPGPSMSKSIRKFPYPSVFFVLPSEFTGILGAATVAASSSVSSRSYLPLWPTILGDSAFAPEYSTPKPQTTGSSGAARDLAASEFESSSVPSW